MEGGRTTEPEFDEFEMLLGEIPKTTLGNPHAGHPSLADTSLALEIISTEEKNKMSSPSSKFTNLYNSPHSVKNAGNMNFFGGPTFPEMSVDQNHQSNGNNGYDIHVWNGENLPNGKSLASAFEELSFKERVVPKPSNPSLLKYNQTSPNHSSLNNLPALFGIDTSEMPVPPLHHPMNGIDIDKQHNVNFPVCNGLEPKKPKPEIISSDFINQQKSFPVYNGAMPLNPRVNAYQLIPNGPVAGIELTTPPYQQQFFLDAQSPTFISPQHLGQSNMTQHNLEEEMYYRLQQQYLYQQQLHNHRSEVIQFRKNMNSDFKPFSESQIQPYYEIPNDRSSYWSDNVVHSGYTQVDLSAIGNGLRQCPPQTSYGRVESCEFPHRYQHCATKNFLEHEVLDKVRKHYFPEKALTRSHGVNSLRYLKSNSFATNQSTPFANNNGRYFSDGQGHHIVMNNGSLKLDSQKSRSSSPDSIISGHDLRSIQVKYNSLNEVMGRIYSLAKDQHGCRFLQKQFTEGTLEDVNKIFFEIIGHIVELMTDPFGNYLIQKMLEVCTEDQRMQIIHAITREAGVLIEISCNMHGTRAVQKVIETVQTTEQICMVISSLNPGLVSLIKDVNGSHVVQRCLQCFSSQQNEFLFYTAISHCVEIAMDRQGCCVIQKCVDNSYGDQRNRLMSRIACYSLVLSQDPYGNYVLQHVLDQKIPWVVTAVMHQLERNYGCLSMQTGSSHVVERCLRYSKEEERVKIIQELMNSPQFLQILQDAYGNYVIQTAMRECKGAVNAALVEAIKPHVPALRSHPYGKKVLSIASLKK